jgi:hypothetical protein
MTGPTIATFMPSQMAINATAAAQTAGPVQFSRQSGFYTISFFVTLASASGAEIRYTLDGAEPDSSDALYTSPIVIRKTCVLRARTVLRGLPSGPVHTHTYIFPPLSDLPVIALTTDPKNLWDTDTGIYVLGRSYQLQQPFYGANFWEDWERPVHIEFFAADGTLEFQQEAGIKIFGGWSRARPQKPFALYARNEYGNNSFDGALFPSLPFRSYKTFILRNSANDWDRTFFCDGLIHSLVQELDLEKQAYRPCAIYLNGVYWGILNMREKINEDYLHQHHPDIDPENIDLLELNGSVLEGDNSHYAKLWSFINTHDLSLAQNYQFVKTLLDVENFITYQAVQIYIDNRDWPGNNIKFWRPRDALGRWRWILYDTEWGFGINAYGAGNNANGYDYNTLAYATSPTQTPNHHGNPPWSTFLLRSLLKNQEFKQGFINRFADLIHYAFRPDRVQARIDSFHNVIADEMPRHYETWRQPVWWSTDRLWWSSFAQWYSYIRILSDFARYRPAYMRAHLLRHFSIKQVCPITVTCEPAQSGYIVLNDFLTVDAFPFDGQYFTDVPIKITARALPGYRFDGWSGSASSNQSTISVAFAQSGTLVAHFIHDTSIKTTPVINEINFRSADDFDTEDWIELFNAGAEPIDLAGWYVTDGEKDHRFIFPYSTTLPGGHYLVVCRDSSRFKSFYANGIHLIGNLPFGLSSSGDQVKLFDAKDRLVDSVAYRAVSPWPMEANGNGATLQLIDPESDNAVASNWAAGLHHGTPGSKNTTPTRVKDETANSPGSYQIQNYPNPFNAETKLVIEISHPCPIRIRIYNLRGEIVATLFEATWSAGQHTVTWDGRDHSGIQVETGVYFCELLGEQVRSVRRLLLIR